MSKLCVGVVFGGYSLEHEVSIKSAINIVQNIDRDRFNVVVLWIDKKGCWHIIDGDIIHYIFFEQKNRKCIFLLLQNDMRKFILYSESNINNVLKIDVIFPIVHGNLGEDGALQGLLRMINVPFVGSDVLGSSINMNKDISKQLLRDAGLSVAPFKVFVFREKNNINFNDIVNMFGLPFFVKPTNQGSSIGVSKIVDYDDFDQALTTAFSFSHKILIESAIVGRELECAVLGNDVPEISIFGEIILDNCSDFYTYHDKYAQSTLNIIIPAIVNNIISNQIKRIVLRAFQILNCTGMARVDFFLTRNNQVIINEVNTLPGFSDDSMYPKLWEVSGLSCQDLITKLIELAMELHDEKKFCTLKDMV